MNFKLSIDETGESSLSELGSARSGVEVSNDDLYVYLGDEFDMRIGLDAVTEAKPMPDPRPAVYLPMGVSAAVEQLGPDTVCVVGSYDGLVVVDFKQDVEAHTRAPDRVPGDEPAADQQAAPEQPAAAQPASGETPERGLIHVRHLVLSLEKPEDFVQAVNQQARGGSGAAGG